MQLCAAGDASCAGGQSEAKRGENSQSGRENKNQAKNGQSWEKTPAFTMSELPPRPLPPYQSEDAQ